MGRRRWAAAHSLPHYPASYILIERRLSRDAKLLSASSCVTRRRAESRAIVRGGVRNNSVRTRDVREALRFPKRARGVRGMG